MPLGPESSDGELEGAASLSVPGCSVPISVEPGSPDVFLGIALGILRACICTDVYLFIWMCDIGIYWQRPVGVATGGLLIRVIPRDFRSNHFSFVDHDGGNHLLREALCYVTVTNTLRHADCGRALLLCFPNYAD